MTLNISVPNATEELRPKITVIGVGGAGGNAVNTMISANLEGVEFLATNTDGQALSGSLAARKIQLGKQHTQGLGAGSKPEIGRIAAEESIDEILAELADSHMVFITAGMGGGTGTGAAPVIAKACRERGILTVGVITKPFDFEGRARMNQADAGIEELQAYVDTLVIIPNQNLFRLANERTTFADAFAMADQVLHQAVCGITDLMVKPGTINLDFADVRAVMAEMGKAMMGTGEASGENRAANAAEAAINNPLLDETSMKGAQALLINIAGGSDMTLFEVDEAANHIRREVDPDAIIIFGSTHDDRLDGVMRVSVVATGMHSAAATGDDTGFGDMTRTMARPSLLRTPAEPMAPAAPAAPVSHPVASHTVASPMASMMAEDFTLSTTPPVEMPEPRTDAAPAESAGYFSHDPNQQSLMDMVETPDKAEPEAASAPATAFTPAEPQVTPQATPEAMPEAETEAEAAPETATPDEEVAEKGGLIRQLSAVFLGRRAWQSAATAEPEVTPEAEPAVTPEATPEAEPEATPITEKDEPVFTNTNENEIVADTAQVETVPSETAPVETAPVMEAPAAEETTAEEVPSETAPSETATAEAEAEDKPEQLDIEAPAEDIDLEIPAFLRRQAN